MELFLFLLVSHEVLEEFEILLLVQEVKHVQFLLYSVDSVAFLRCASSMSFSQRRRRACCSEISMSQLTDLERTQFCTSFPVSVIAMLFE